MNINVEQFVLIILMVFLLYFVMNKCSCNIEGLQSCPKTEVKSCVGNFGNCDNLFTTGVLSGFHRCKYPKVGGLMPIPLSVLPDAVRNNLPCGPEDNGGDCMYGPENCALDTCVDVRPLGAKIGGTRSVAGKEDKVGTIQSVRFNYIPETNPSAKIRYTYGEGDDTLEHYNQGGRSLLVNGNYEDQLPKTDNDTVIWTICKDLYEKLGIKSFVFFRNSDDHKYHFEAHRSFTETSTLRMLDGSGDYYDMGFSSMLGHTGRIERTNWVNFTSTDSKIQFLVLK